MGKKHKRYASKCVSMLLLSSMLLTNASAVFKEVQVWGVRSINDLGFSDMQITMDDLQDDYSGYLQTDGMTEFFHKDQGEIPKADMNEALSYLIDNEIISRDSKIIVSNLTGVPIVSIVKEDISSKLFNTVTRSDALMYIYKSVFGPLQGRSIGVEAISVRNDNGTSKTLEQMIRDNNYGLWQDIFGEDVAGNGQAGTGVGITGDDATVNTSYRNDSNGWRYTPQGDEYTSVWGDTNIFISQNTFNQESTGGDGGDGVTGGSFNSGVGGVGGQASATINYETDYKSIYLIPGADFYLYQTTDVLEVYLQSIQSKGLLEFEASLRTQEYNSTFMPLTNDNAPLASWSGDADTYIVNLNKGEHVRVENVQYAPLEEILGVNYAMSYSPNSLTVWRSSLFETNSGYFTTELCTRMDIYRYIYSMVSANEKKLTALEADIVNYKYGMQYGDGLPSGDLEVIKFLVAKGILDYDGSDELSGLYAPMNWDQLIPILYRVANENARLDFSQVQLTDSEQAWKAQGFAPSSIQIMPSGAMSSLMFEYTDEYIDSQISDLDTDVGADLSDNSGESRSVGILDNMLSLLLGDSDGVPFITTAKAESNVVANVKFSINAGHLALNHQIYFDFNAVNNLQESNYNLSKFKELLNQMDSSRSYVYSYLGDTYDDTNPKHKLLVEFLQNFHFIAALETQNGLDIARLFKDALEEWEDNASEAILSSTSIDESKGWSITWSKARENFKDYACSLIDDAVNGKNPIKSVNYVINGRTVPSLIDTQIDELYETLNASSTAPLYVSFDYLDSNGGVSSQTLEFSKRLTESSSILNESQMAQSLNATMVTYAKAVTEAELASSTKAEILADAGSSLESIAWYSGLYLPSDNNGADINNYFSSATLNLYSDPTTLDEGYVSWDEISKASNGTIVRESELVLYNTETNTTSYFSDNSDPSKTRALVGSIVINGDSKYGVVKKIVENGVEQIYYHISAVRQLLSLSDEKECIGGRTYIAQADQTVTDNTRVYPVINSIGTQSSSVLAVRAVVHTDASAGDVIHSSNKLYKMGTTLNNLHYCNFISLSQSNKVANTIYRKFTYTPMNSETSGEKNGSGVAYGVVIFRPADISVVGSPAVSSSTSLQDLLDAPGLPPSGNQEVWNTNMQLCNDYANWIYGTTGVKYINTGYLVPEVYLFVIGDIRETIPPTSLFGSLTNAEIQAIETESMGVMKPGQTAIRGASVSGDSFGTSNNNVCAYYVSLGFQAMLSGDRLFLNEALFDNLTFTYTNGTYKYILNNSTQVISPFAVGNVFTFFSSGEGRSYGNPVARVVAVSSNGKVTAQVGPFYGIPVKYSGINTVVSGSLYNSSMKMKDATWNTNTSDGSAVRGVDLWSQFYYDITKAGLTKDWVNSGDVTICQPALFSGKDSSSSVRLVYDGSSVNVYENDKTMNVSKAVNVSTDSTTFKDAFSLLKSSFESSSSLNNASTITSMLNRTEVYFEIQFSAWNYQIKNGVLNYSSNTGMASFLNPVLFTSLNDILIDGMKNESNGAIPVNEIPAGSILKIGDYYYQAVGTSTEQKYFVGYATLYEFVDKPTPVHAAKAFITQMIYAGNQYINVSHFIDPFEMLKNGDESDALSNIARKTLVGDLRQKYSIDYTGNTSTIETGVLVDTTISANFTPVKITFLDGLLAYKDVSVEKMQDISTEDSKLSVSGTDTYILCNSAESAMSGAFQNVPFLVDDVLNVSLYSVTSEIVTTGFQLNHNAPGIQEALRLEFQKAFSGDLITLIRMLVFIVLVWLVIASWMCYVSRVANLTIFFEALRHPSRDTSRKGIDFFKIVSLGTITLDTEFTLGRFLQYNLILSALLCVVMLSGRITI